MKNVIKIAFLSSVITAAMVYVILGWRPPQPEAVRASGGASWTSTPTSVAVATPVVAEAAPAPTPVALGDDERNNIDIYKKYSPAVVNITATSLAYDFFLRPVPQTGTGSGAIIDAEGHIVTNHHVIEGGLSRGGTLEVTLADKSKHPAKVVGDDPNNDLAVLQIDAPRSRLSSIPLGSSTGLQVGQKVLAIGNPFGLERTLTTGIISSLGRAIETDNGRVIEDIIQTDAAINPGNSGGPLLNTSGEIIGINTAIISPTGSNSGIGFAIPANTVQRITKDLITLGYVRRPWLGIKSYPLGNLGDYAQVAGFGVDSGLMVLEVTAGSPAERAGLRAPNREAAIRNLRIPVGEDVILAVDGREVNTPTELSMVLDRHNAGDRITLKVQRGNQKIDIPVTLQEAPRSTR
jgi:S1-C subfamily serine protease